MEKKTTLKQYFTEVINVLNGEEPTIPTEELVEVMEQRIAQLDKKSASKKPTAKDAANEELKATIVDILTELGSPVTASVILSDNRIPSGTSLPKITSMLTALVNDKIVTRTVDKRKAYFYIPTDDDTEVTED